MTRAASLLGLLLVFGVALGDARAESPRRTYSVVIGSNLQPVGEAAALRYAFADAARMYRLLSGLEGPATLFGAPGQIPGSEDADVRADMRPVTLDAVRAELKRIARFAASDRARGIETHLVFYYSGHGVEARLEGPDGAQRQGYLPLGDDRVDGPTLLTLLDLAGTDFKHLILDACHATAVARDTREGSGDVMSRSLQAGIAQRPEIGLITAETQQRQAIELDRLRGGQLTHFIHSGLAGLADANGDLRISYAELYRFAASGGLWASKSVRAMRMRVEAPHGDLETPVVDLRWRPRGPTASHRWVRVMGGPSARYRAYADGELYAHWRAEEGHAARLLVPAKRALEVFRCVRCGEPGAQQLRILELPGNAVPGVEVVLLAPEGWRPFAVRAVDDWSWGLFPLGYGPQASKVIPLPEMSPRPAAARTLAAAAPGDGSELPLPALASAPSVGRWPALEGGAFGTASYFGIGLLTTGAGLAAGVGPWAFQDRNAAISRALDDTEDRGARRRARSRHRLALGALIAGGILAASGSALMLWEHFSVSPTVDGGATVELQW